MTNQFDQLVALDLNDEGREGVEVKGGGAKFPTAVPSGYYLATFNRYGACGPINTMQAGGKGQKPEARTVETIKLGFELIECVAPVDPAAKDFELIKTYKKDDVEEKVPYIVDLNGIFNITRSNNDKAKFPKIVDRMRRALPYDLQDKVKAEGKTLSDAFPTVKSMFGQQMVIYVQRAKRGEREFNEVLFTGKAVAAMTEYNKEQGFPKDVQEVIEVYPHDDKERSIGFAGCEAGKPLNTKAVLFDIDAKDMQQVHLDSIAHEYFYIGKDAIQGKAATVEFCEILDANMKLGKYADTVFGEKVKKGELVIPEPKPKTTKEDTTKEVDDNFEDTSALEAVKSSAPVPVVEVEKGAEEATEEYGL